MTDQRLREIVATALKMRVALEGPIVTNKHIDDTAVTISRLIRIEERQEHKESYPKSKVWTGGGDSVARFKGETS